MAEQPIIHFLSAYTFQECETKVNAWIDELPFLCSVLSINVLPMLLEGKLTFLTVIMYTRIPAYANSGEGR